MPFPHPVSPYKPRGVPERPSEKKRKRRALVLAALPGTQPQIVSRTKLGHATVLRWLKDLHHSGEARIKRWTRTEGRFAAVWGKGGGEHAPCELVPLDSKERRALAKVRARAEAEVEQADRARRLAAIQVRRDPLVAALFGAASC